MNKKPLLKAAGIFVAGLAAFYLVFRGAGAPEKSGPRPAPDFTLPDLSGRNIPLSRFKGDVILLDFWATWCGPCREEVPVLNKLYAAYKDRGFAVVAVSLDFLGRKAVAPFVEKEAIAYPVLLSGGIAPPGYDIPGLPVALLIDRQGMIVEKYAGTQSLGVLESGVRELLASGAKGKK